MRDFFGQIVVVDTGSQDATIRVAEDREAEVLRFPWQGDFAAARNAGLERARGRYVLVMDADEYLGGESAEVLRFLFSTAAAGHRKADAILSEGDAYSLLPAYACLLQDMDADDRRGMQARIVRLFPNLPTIRYEWPVHEQVETALRREGHPVLPAEVVIYHTGYADPERRKQKQRRNLAILHEQITVARRRGEEVHPMTLFLAGGAALDLGDPSEALQFYEQCAQNVSAESDIGRATVVRQATCWTMLKRWDQVAQLAEPGTEKTWHPELLVERGKACLAGGGGETDSCRKWFERALAAPECPRLPACNHGAMRAEALMGLGEYWHKVGGRPALGVALLRVALAERQGGPPVSLRQLSELHAEHEACLWSDSVA